MSTHDGPMSPPIIVGVDGSASSLVAVDCAAREAVLRHHPIRVVHAFIWPYFPHVSLDPSLLGPPEGGLRNAAERVVRDAVERARSAAPGVHVSGELITGAPVPVLLSCARDAAMVVVGSRGLGGFTGLLIGSVAVQLAGHAPCPVLVARGEIRSAAPVLLAVDGSPANQPAVGFAFDEAALRGVALHALHAWSPPVPLGPRSMQPVVYDPTDVAAQEARVLAEALAGWSQKYPDVIVERSVIRGNTRRSLINATVAAQLVIAGTRGHGGFTGLLLGSVSQALLHHAACPVAIIGADGTDR